MLRDSATEDLHARLKSLVDTLEGALSSSGDKSKEKMSKIHSKAEHALRESRHRLSETSNATAKQAHETAAKAGSYACENPWANVGVDATVGAVLGVPLSRR